MVLTSFHPIRRRCLLPTSLRRQSLEQDQSIKSQSSMPTLSSCTNKTSNRQNHSPIPISSSVYSQACRKHLTHVSDPLPKADHQPGTHPEKTAPQQHYAPKFQVSNPTPSQNPIPRTAISKNSPKTKPHRHQPAKTRRPRRGSRDARPHADPEGHVQRGPDFRQDHVAGDLHEDVSVRSPVSWILELERAGGKCRGEEEG